jgi:hypothetical protein
MDERAGHRRRYTREALAAELAAHGWSPAGHTHYQFLLYPLVKVSHALGRRSDDGFERRPAAWVDRLLGAANAAEVALLGGLSLPAGSTVFLWGRPAPGVGGPR